MYQYFLVLENKIIQIPTSLCTKDSEQKSEEGKQIHKEVIVTSLL